MDLVSICTDLSDLCFEINDRKSNISRLELECLIRRTEEVIRVLDYMLEVENTDASLTAQIRIDFFAYYQDMSRQLMASPYNPSLAVYTACPPATYHQNGPGRPKLHIEVETLTRLRMLGYSWVEISKILLVSRWTLSRRVIEFGIQDVTGYTDIDDGSLDAHLSACLQNHGLLTG